MPKYVAIGLDIENTGKSLSKHAIVQIGARIMLVEDGKWERAESFSVVINVPSDKGWEQRCVYEFWNSQDNLKELKRKVDAKEGKEPDVAMREFEAFLLWAFHHHAGGDINRIRLVTDTVSFDACWLNYYLDRYIDSDPLHLIFGGFRDLIETGSYMQGVSGITFDDEIKLVEASAKKRKAEGKEGRGYFSMEKSLWEKRKIQKKSEAEHNHDAVSDATNIVENFLIAMYSQAPEPEVEEQKEFIDENSVVEINGKTIRLVDWDNDRNGIGTGIFDIHCKGDLSSLKEALLVSIKDFMSPKALKETTKFGLSGSLKQGPEVRWISVFAMKPTA